MFNTTGSQTLDFQSLVDLVKSRVDCQKLIPDDGSREEFNRYVRQSCISPSHPDREPTMLIFNDGVNCPACGLKEDAIGIYRMWHPDVGFRQACEALLANDALVLEGGAQSDEPRNTRALDPDVPIKYHFELAKQREALAALMRMGFTTEAIRHYKMGYARVLARLKLDQYGLADTAEDIEWLTIKDKRVPYQWQWRFSVPVYVEGRLRQILYRQGAPGQLGEKITMEKDAGAHLFGVDELANAHTAMFVEGWGDKVVCWQWGFVAVTSTNGAGHWNSDWKELLGNVRRLYVVGDADEAGKKMLARVKKDLPWARPLRLPWPHGSKKDLRDGCLAGWTKQDVMRLMKQAEVRGAWTITTGR